MADALVAANDGRVLALHDLGGEGATALLVHAASFCASMFTPLARSLGGHYHCLAPDLAGHGRSPRPNDGDFSWTRLADDLTAVIDTTTGPLYGFGHSFGATLLLAAAARRKGRFTAIVAYEPVLVSSERSAQLAEEQAVRAERRRYRFESDQELVERLVSRAPLDHLDPAALWAYVRDGFTKSADDSVHLVLSPLDEATIYRASVGANFEDELAHLDVAVTLFVGDKSRGAIELGAGRLASILPRVRLETIEGADHLAPLETPLEIAERAGRAFDTAAA